MKSLIKDLEKERKALLRKLHSSRIAIRVISTWASMEITSGRRVAPEDVIRLCDKTLEKIATE